jgi:hypothetical protein
MLKGYQNSDWGRRTNGIQTDRKLVHLAVNRGSRFRKLMSDYRPTIEGYLTWFLIRYRLLSNEYQLPEAVAGIWDVLLKVMQEKLTERWNRDDVRFRDLLLEGIHEAHLHWHRISDGGPTTEELIPKYIESWRGWREGLLERARERLRAFQDSRESMRNRYYTVFILWESHREESRKCIARRLHEMTGGAIDFDEYTLNQTLGRALDVFGPLLLEEARRFARRPGACKVEDCVELLEDLDLMNDYIMKSKKCRELLDLD